MATNGPTGTTNQNSNRIEVDAGDAAADNTETRSNADLYIVTPPAYTQSIAEGETSVNAELVQPEKPARQPEQPPRHGSPPEVPLQRASSLPAQLEAPYHDEPQVQTSPHSLNLSPAIPPPTSPPILHHHLAEPYATAALVGARPCSILRDRPAIWLVKNRKIALSPLAAAVIVKEGLIAPKELVLITPYSAMRRDPTDPISGVLLGTYDGVGEIMLGLVAGPVELGRQKIPGATHEGANVKGSADVAAKVAVETGKGLGRIVTGALKTPVLVTNGLTRGFHNLPKLYGEQVREYENVTGLRSGLTSFGYGLSDGLVDLFAKPVQGAERDGLVGFASGIAKGLGNAIFKPAAGACGLVGYSTVGLYKSVRHNSLWTKDEVDPMKVILELGGEEYSRATDADRIYVVRVWCQNMMRVRLV